MNRIQVPTKVPSLSRPRRLSSLLAVVISSATLALGASARAIDTYAKTVAGANDSIDDNVVFQQADSDVEGNTFVAGGFRGSAVFAPGVSLTPKIPLSPVTEPSDAFLGRLDSKGGWSWVRRVVNPLVNNTEVKTPNGTFTLSQLTTPAADIWKGANLPPPFEGLQGSTREALENHPAVFVLDVKASTTNVYVVGTFKASAGNLELGFVTKFLKNGTLAWTRFIVSGSGRTSIQAITEAPDGSIYFGGVSRGECRMYGLGADSRLINVGLSNESSNFDSALVVKLDTNGSFQWATRTGRTGTSGDAWIAALEANGLGEVHALMNFRGTGVLVRHQNGTDFDGNGAPAGTALRLAYSSDKGNVFVGKLSPSGTWSGRVFGGTAELGAVATTGSIRGTDLELIAGRIYLSGSFDSGKIRAGGFLARLSAENYTSDEFVAYMVAGGHEGEGSYPTRIRSTGRGLLVTGRSPVSLRIHGRVAANSEDMEDSDSELVSLQTTEYLASFDLELGSSWVRSTSRPESLPRPKQFVASLLSFDPASSRVYWGGAFLTRGSEKLVLGEPPTESTLATSTTEPRPFYWGWLTAFDAEGRPIRQVRLTVQSALPPISINGTPIDTSSYSDTFLEGTSVQVAVQDQEVNGTRRLVTGYTLDTQTGTTEAKSLTATLLADTTVTFKWRTQHRLTIESDHATAGLISAASAGNPEPLYGQRWIDEGEYVDATVDGFVEPVDPALWGSRFVVRSYTFTQFNPTSATLTQAVDQVVARVRVEPLKSVPMTRPATVKYLWKKQYRVSLQVADPQADGLVSARQTSGATKSLTTAGETWFDDSASVELLARASNGSATLALLGWDYASPVPDYFQETSFLASDPFSDIASQLTKNSALVATNIGGVLHYAKRIASLTQNLSVLWNYGDPTYTFNVAVGSAFKFPSLPAKGATPTTGWRQIRILDAPPGSQGEEMMVWDPKNQAAIPTRPGIFLVDLVYGVEPNTNKVVLQVYSGFSGDLHQNDPTKTKRYNNPAGFQRHIADTPPVTLDRFPRDKVFFKEFRYTTSDATVTDGKFRASVPGLSVLVFSGLPAATSGIATGDLTRENLDVRVVQTLAWNSVLATSSSSAIVGSALVSSDDKANLRTGYVVHEVSNYNPEIYDRNTLTGPIIPVNSRATTADPTSDRELVVVWYEEVGSVVWPYKPVHYPSFAWPPGSQNRIVIASRLGSEGLDGSGDRQIRFDPNLYSDVKIYNQPDREKPGYNPNEEHARIYPSLHASLAGRAIPAAFALRDDLNITSAIVNSIPGRLTRADYTSDPYVLVQYVDRTTGQPGMRAYAVIRSDPTTKDPWVQELPGSTGNSYVFQYRIVAGERIAAPYPLNLVVGLDPCINNVANLFSNGTAVPNGTYFGPVNGPRAWFVDHREGTWAVAGDSAIRAFFAYRVEADFSYPFDKDNASIAAARTGDCIPWLPKLSFVLGQLGVFDPDAADFRVRTEPIEVTYSTHWPVNPPVLEVGETLTYAGGEYKSDHPDAPGLPGILGFAAAEVVFDSKNPQMRTLAAETPNYLDSFSARVISPLEPRQIAVPISGLPSNLRNPASPEVTVDGDTWYFNKLSPSLRKRVYYKPLAKLTASSPPGVLGVRGYVNDRTLGASDLTATPPPLYVLEPNVLTRADRDELLAVAQERDPWIQHVERLFALSRNPEDLDPGGGSGWNVGLERIADNRSDAKPLAALGPGLALVTNPRLLDPSFGFGAGQVGYVTIAENNHESLGDAPVTLHVIRIDPAQRYRGGIKIILPSNVFDEKVTLRHTADFGGNVDGAAFTWWYREEDGTTRTGDIPPGIPGTTPVWNAFGSADGVPGRVEIQLDGNPALLVADNMFFARYRAAKDPYTEPDWSQWAGAANSSIADLDGDSRPDLRAQLAVGWVKRVLDAVNPYEARIRDFGKTDSPTTASSMIRQLGSPYVGAVALNASKDVVENLGLVELYETVLRRARDMTVDGSAGTTSSGINAAILLASTRLGQFYALLGNEAWDDALDPTIGFGNDRIDHGNLGAARFCFENQQPNLLSEELALLRGLDESYGRPAFNRLFWNFTKSEGEVAYALNYQIADVNQDGFIDEGDARVQYPMGHGDAWGHYLSAMKKHYDLLRIPVFDWENRGEYYSLLDTVIGVDFQDERGFAKTAAARARVGTEIVNLTFRSRYSEAPDSKLSGYTDPDRDRAWGVTEWARRTAQGAYFDWVTANALLPLDDTRADRVGPEKLDRRTITEIAEIASHVSGIQVALDNADSGLNAIGLDPDVLPFDIDPTFLDVGSTAQVGSRAVQGLSHYEQIFERAVEAMRNADAAFDYASQQKIRLRETETSTERLRLSALAQDREFRNRLIAIFGTPYTGQIGAGKAYPAGYAGPDLNLFMYVDVNAVSADTVPIANSDTYFDEYVSFYDLAQDIPEEFRVDIEDHFLDDISLDGNTLVELLDDGLVHLRLPATAGDYTFVAPENWGQRDSPGRLQTLVGEMLQVQATLAIAVGDYDFLIKQLRDRVSMLKMRADINSEILGIREAGYDRLIGMNAAISALEAAAVGYRAGADWLDLIGEATSELPRAVGTANDVTAPARQAIKFAATAGWLASTVTATASEIAAGVLGNTKEIVDLRDEIDIDKKEMSVELRGMLHDIEELLVNEGVTRIRLFTLREQLRGLLDQYRATLQEGIRLVEERRNANVEIAASTQGNRYHDMLFRSGRHESIQRYRDLFDLAQRYCYLAGKAYDYETNFDPRDRASARPLLAEIVRTRSLGRLDDRTPLAGPGLAGVMAKLHDNFRAIEGRLGFNSLQLNITEFSLRKEMARIPSDTDSDSAWRDYLTLARLDDLWADPYVRQYCRPFSASNPQPGLVLRFRTTISPGRNFFDQFLGAGDSAYDPTLYATKIRSVGIRFVGYPIELLARTPHVYLVPAGADYMTIPNSPTLEPRSWNVVDQAIPVPFATGPTDLAREGWQANVSTLSGTFGEIRRFSSFRAGILESDPSIVATRLVGRSAWNGNWLLVIPAQTLHAFPQIGEKEFLDHVRDIRLTFETYGYSGN